ncbi:hypothetical protein ISS03_04345 [Patescibacteria group bacterium]|nr:hypothetical protein [Patescibacteria group bacterium]
MPSDAIGLNGMSPLEKAEQLGICNAEKICRFPILILDDIFFQFKNIFTIKLPKKFICPKSQNVLTPYLFR